MRSRTSKSSSGFTLIEIIIALAISGLIVSLGLNLYVQSNRYNEHAKSYQLLRDNGSTALTILGNYIRDAGFGGLSPWSHEEPIERPSPNCVTGFCADATANAGVLVLRSDPANDFACNGYNTTTPNERVLNRFFVDTATSTLRCSAYSLTLNSTVGTQNFVLQDGIEAIEFEYFLTNGTMTRDAEVAFNTGVRAIKVSVLAVSNLENTVSNVSRTYNMAGTPVTETSTTLKQVFQSSFIINSTFSTGL